jgi:hypothetical protein
MATAYGSSASISSAWQRMARAPVGTESMLKLRSLAGASTHEKTSPPDSTGEKA